MSENPTFFSKLLSTPRPITLALAMTAALVGLKFFRPATRGSEGRGGGATSAGRAALDTAASRPRVPEPVDVESQSPKLDFQSFSGWDPASGPGLTSLSEPISMASGNPGSIGLTDLPPLGGPLTGSDMLSGSPLLSDAAPLVGPLGSSNLSGSLVDQELASIPVPHDFKDVEANPAAEFLEEGSRLQRQSKWDEAIKAFYQALNVEPNNARAYDALGMCYVEKNEPAKAMANLDSAIRLNPKSAMTYVHRARANSKLLYSQRALQDLDTALKLEPDNIAALTWRAITHINEGHAREAHADCTVALKLNSGVLDAYVVRCLANLQLRDPNGARADYQAGAQRGLNAEMLKMMRNWFKAFGQQLPPGVQPNP